VSINDKEMIKINIRLTREEKNICDTEARKRGMSRNAFLRELIIEKPMLASMDDKIDFIVSQVRHMDENQPPKPEH
jgi:hypothetical protein